VSFDEARRFRDQPSPSLEFSALDVYKRRTEITDSIDVWFTDTGQWRYLAMQNGKISDEVREWCEANFKSAFTFSKMTVAAITAENLHLHVTSDTDALNFIMRWF
jgi:hypothetical protein